MIGNLRKFVARKMRFARLAGTPLAGVLAYPDNHRSLEAERARLADDHSPLADGSLGPPGPFDDCTVSKANEASRDPNGCLLLYSLARRFEPRTVLELGTNLGISSAYLASAGGAVTTLDGSAYRQRQARTVHGNLGLNGIDYVQGLFDETLGPTLAKLGRVDLTFIDGHHQYQPTLDYFEAIRGYGHDGTVYLFDDVKWSPDMMRAWRELQPAFAWTHTMGGIGIGLMRR